MMTPAKFIRLNRLERRNEIRKQEEQKNFDSIKQQHMQEKDQKSACFRNLMLKLAIRASIGNPAKAVSSAVSRPDHMCEALASNLHSCLRDLPISNNLHFKIKDGKLTIQRFSTVSVGRIADVPMIQVSVGKLQRGQGYGDHVCNGLYCELGLHGLTTIVCPCGFDLYQHFIAERIDGHNRFMFQPRLLRNTSWSHWVNPTGSDEQRSTRFEVRYLDNEASGLHDLILSIICNCGLF
jgi:hypothetical protein